MTSPSRFILTAAGLLGLAGVALGAFGAHALKDTLASLGTTQTWQTAVLYHLVHTVALFALGSRAGRPAMTKAIGWCWITGVVFFSGSLYALSLGGPRLLGPVTPLGGVLFLAGWALVAWQAWRHDGNQEQDRAG